MKDHVEKDHLTKSDVVMLSIDQGMDLQTLFRIHPNVSNFLIASPKIILTPHFFFYDFCDIHKNDFPPSYFQIVGETFETMSKGPYLDFCST